MNLYPLGSRISGRYEVASRPLMGGMGIVYLCYDHGQNRPVALKTFKPEFLPDRAARDRFLREGDTWIKLEHHPNIVRAYNVVRLGDGTEVYLVLELIAKEQGLKDASLRSWLTPRQPLPIEQVMLFTIQVIRGMQYATSKIPGFVHRDLKPENLLIGSDKLTNADVNRLRVTDLGLAAVLGDVREAGIVGTPLYMAPEQWRGEAVSTATDIYALGCIVFEMLAGEPAVSGTSLSALEQAHQASNRKALPAKVHVELREWLERCLRVEPAARYASWAATEAGLERAYGAVTGKPLPEAEVAGEMGRAEQIAAGSAQIAIGSSYLDIGKVEVARDYFESAAEIGKKEGDKHLEGAALGNLGNTYYNLGEVRRAIGYFEQHLTIAREIGDRREEGAVLSNLGNAYSSLGEVRGAIGYFEQALAIHHAMGNRREEGTTLGNLGVAYARLGEVRRAIGYHERALAIHRTIGDRRGEGDDLGNLGIASTNLGEMSRAIGYFEQHLTVVRAIGDRRGEGAALGNLGNAYYSLGDVQGVIGYFEQALAIDREIGNKQGEGNALGSLGLVHAKLGEMPRAIGYFEQALVIHRTTGNRSGEGTTLGNLGNVYRILGEVSRAIGYHERALAIHCEIGNKQGEAIDSFNAAHLYHKEGNTTKALPLARHALSLFQQMGSPAAQRAEQLLVALEGDPPSGGGGSDVAKLLQQFGQLIVAIVAATRGDKQAKAAVEEILPQLEQRGFHIVGPIKQIWKGERNEIKLSRGLDKTDAFIVREILAQLK